MAESTGRLAMIKFMELLLTGCCAMLHYYSFGDRDVFTTFLSTGTFFGYIVILVAIFAGYVIKAPFSKQLDVLLSLIGSATHITSGVFLIGEWEDSFRTRTRDIGMLKGALAIINGVIFALDALITFRDKK